MDYITEDDLKSLTDEELIEVMSALESLNESLDLQEEKGDENNE